MLKKKKPVLNLPRLRLFPNTSLPKFMVIFDCSETFLSAFYLLEKTLLIKLKTIVTKFL